MAALATTPFATAQVSPPQSLGYWDDVMDSVTPSTELYVAVTGADTNPGTPASPFRSISAALMAMPGGRVTINVGPGPYDESVETFPLTLPAYGVSLECWPGGRRADDPPRARPVVGPSVFPGEPPAPVIQIDRVGDPSLPATVIQTLEIRHGQTGIDVDPALMMEDPSTVRVEIRQCFVHDNTNAEIRLNTENDWVAFHVLEDNDIGDDSCVPHFAPRGIIEMCEGFSSTLMRSNRVIGCEEGIIVEGPEPYPDPSRCHPRLLSNWVQLCQHGVRLERCDAHVVNNTIAFSVEYQGVDVTPEGLSFAGGHLELHNNILWNPIDICSGIDPLDFILVSGTLSATSNLLQDLLPCPPLCPPGFIVGTPSFVGGDQGRCQCDPAVDLHLLSTSAMIDAGTTTRAVDVTQPFRPFLEIAIPTVPATFLRTDINLDVDLDARVLSPTGAPAVDIGGDELSTSRITLPLVMGGPNGLTPIQDGWGNILPSVPQNGGSTYRVRFDLTGPPGGSWSLFVGSTFFDTLFSYTTFNSLPNTPIYQNSLTGVGSFGLDLEHLFYALARSGTFDSTGSATVFAYTIGTLPAAYTEAEYWFQMTTVGGGGFGSSNRVKVELNL